jgi:hypothetical protein
MENNSARFACDRMGIGGLYKTQLRTARRLKTLDANLDMLGMFSMLSEATKE